MYVENVVFCGSQRKAMESLKLQVKLWAICYACYPLQKQHVLLTIAMSQILGTLSLCVCVFCFCTTYLCQRWPSESLRMDLQLYDTMSAGNWTWILWKSSQCSEVTNQSLQPHSFSFWEKISQSYLVLELTPFQAELELKVFPRLTMSNPWNFRSVHCAWHRISLMA